MNIKVDFDNIVVKEDKNDFNVKVLMLKGEKGDKGDGELNVIDTVKVNGTTLPVTNKTVNVPVPVVDSAISSSSANPVQNKVIYEALSGKADTSALDNYYEISEVDELINQKPYYFDNVAEMKSFNLKKGDMAITLGYSNANDGGGAKYEITDTLSNKWQENLNNGLYAELIANDKNNFIKASTLGLETTQSTQIASNNFIKIKKAIESGYDILFDNLYPIDNINLNNLIKIDRPIKLYGISEGAGVYKQTNNNLYLFDMMEGNICINGLTFINNYDMPIYIVQNYTNKLYKKKYGELFFENCTVNGNFVLLNLHQENFYEGDETWGASKVHVENCIIQNNFNTFLHISDMPAKMVELNNNKISNFKRAVLTLTAFHSNEEVEGETVNPYGEDLTNNWIDGVTAINNIVENDDTIFETGNLYHTFIMTKSKMAVLKNNKISGIKSNDNGTAISSAYLSSNFVIFENNIVENCVNFAGVNVLLKSKQANIVKYINNKFTINETWLNTINNGFDTPYTNSQLESNTSFEIIQTINDTMDHLEISNNNINVPYFANDLNERVTAKTIIIKGNIMEFKTFSNYFINNYDRNENVVFSDNVIKVSNSKDNTSGVIYTPNDAINGNYEISNNTIIFNNKNVYAINILKSIKSLKATNNIIENQYADANGCFINFSDVSIIKTVISKNNVFKDNGKMRPFRFALNEYFMGAELSYYGKTFNDVTTMNNINIYLPRFTLYNSEVKYKLKINYFDSNNVEQKATYIFKIYPSNNKNYVNFVRTNDTVEDIDLMTAVSTLTAKNIKCNDNNSMENNVCQYYAVTGGNHLIRFNYAFFNDTNKHNVKISIEAI